MLDINNLDESKSGRKNNIKISDIGWSSSQRFYVFIIKPVLDIFFAVIGLILLLPLFLVISVAIKLDSRGPVFFRQERVGKDCRVFTLLKFRSMKIESNKRGIPLKDIERITKVGQFIRKASLDELPQLINIINGKMSFIGPRPLLSRYLPYYTKEENKRHLLRPGISGLAQTVGRNLLNWDDRLVRDIEYTKNISIKMDIKIWIITILKILKSEDIVIREKNPMLDFDSERGKVFNAYKN